MDGIKIENVSKSFGQTKALEKVNIEFMPQKIYGLLGRNGAGKSTLLNIISNRIFADEGTVLINGEAACENDKAQSLLYSMSEKTYYPENMKIKKVFEWTKTFYPDFDAETALDMAKQFKLNINKTVKSLSTGYNSIFKLIIALNVNVPYIFLDEPVLGLDANHRDLFYRLLIEHYTNKLCTIVISTHLIEEVSGIIEDVVIINNGKIIRSESRDNLLAAGYSVTGKVSDVEKYMQGKDVLGTEQLGGMKTAYILGRQGSAIPETLEKSTMDLQKLFIKLTESEDI